jgi:hypothetical protein
MNDKRKTLLMWAGAIALLAVSFGLGLLTGAFTIDTKSSTPDWSKLSQVDIEGDRSVFGGAISISLSANGMHMAVGDPVYGDNTGRVRMYQREGKDWKPMGQELIGEQAQIEFGYSVDISSDGSVAAIGARAIGSLEADDIFSFMQVYKYTGTEWRLMGDTIFHNSGGFFCGQSVTLSGSGSRAAMICSNDIRVVEFDGTAWNVLGSSDIPSLGSEKIALSSDGDVLALDYFSLDFDGAEWLLRNASLLEEGPKVMDFALSGDGSAIATTFVYYDFPQDTSATKVYHFSGIGWKQSGQSIMHESSSARSINYSRVTLSQDGGTMAISSSLSGQPERFGSATIRVYSYNGTMWNLRGDPLVGSDSGSGVFMDLSGSGAVVAAYNYGGKGNGAISSYHFK